MNNITGGLLPIIGIYVIIIGVVIVMLIQFLMIRKFKKLFKDLATVFSKGKNLDYITLVDRIIRSRELYKPGPSTEIIDLISNYIKELFKDSRVFIHVTNDKEIADKIISEGFKYSEDFYKSSEEVSANLFDLTYKLQIYKHYGDFVIIICIPKDLYNEVQKKGVSGDKDYLAEYGISEYNPDNELSYKLPSCFVKGYIDINKKQIVNNTFFQIKNKRL